jgi:8-oxo-dGTP pyrophosphatase MutT (NUDIX family)
MWTVSVKGVVYDGSCVLLARNDRSEWELPGGQLESDETPEECVEREILEETGLQERAGPLLRSWIFEVFSGKRVLVLAHGCRLESSPSSVLVSTEHTEVTFVDTSRLGSIALPDGYRSAIDGWPSR